MVDGEANQHARRTLIGSVVSRVAPAIVSQIDMDDLIAVLDVDAIAADLDLDALIARLDVDAIAARLDLDALITRLDVDAIAARLDLDALIARLDVNAIADRIDIERLMGRIDMAQLTAGATQDVAISGLDLVRRQIMRVDASVDGLLDRVLRRKPGSRPDAPTQLADAAPVAPEATPPNELQRRDVSGHYAGAVTRLLSVAGDVAAVFAINAALASMILFLFGADLSLDWPLDPGEWLALSLLASVFVGWFWLPVTWFGRTPAMGLLGIAVVRRDGDVATSSRALVRALVLPVTLLFPVLFIGLVAGRERRTLHDVVSGTAVVYDWGARDAEQPVTIREQLSARVRRRQAGDA